MEMLGQLLLELLLEMLLEMMGIMILMIPLGTLLGMAKIALTYAGGNYDVGSTGYAGNNPGNAVPSTDASYLNDLEMILELVLLVVMLLLALLCQVLLLVQQLVLMEMTLGIRFLQLILEIIL